jgi:hypothetical protein
MAVIILPNTILFSCSIDCRLWFNCLCCSEKLHKLNFIVKEIGCLTIIIILSFCKVKYLNRQIR